MLLLALVSLFYLQSLMSSTLKTSCSIYRILSYSAMLAWVVFALIGTVEQIKEWLSLLWPVLVCFLVAATLYLIRSNDNYLAATTKNILFFAFFAFIFLYYSRPGFEKFRTIIVAFWFLETVISCVHSIIFLQKYPDYARALLSPDMYGVYDGLQTYTMIGFYHVGALSFLTPAFLYRALGKRRKSGYESLILIICCLLFPPGRAAAHGPASDTGSALYCRRPLIFGKPRRYRYFRAWRRISSVLPASAHLRTAAAASLRW